MKETVLLELQVTATARLGQSDDANDEGEQEDAVEDENYLELCIQVEEVIVVHNKDTFSGFILFMETFSSIPSQHVSMDTIAFENKLNLG